ncbi:MAG: hypothetical protein V3V23_06155 [Dehalococcoidales bacterium]
MKQRLNYYIVTLPWQDFVLTGDYWCLLASPKLTLAKYTIRIPEDLI